MVATNRDAIHRCGRGTALFVLGALASAAVPAAVFQVNSTADAGDPSLDGVCETAPGSGVCTLRAAFEESRWSAADDFISLPAGEFALASPLGGILESDGFLQIIGAGPGVTVLRGDTQTPSLASLLTHFNTLALDRLSVTHFPGTAIRSNGQLSVSDCTFAHNGTGGYDGGSIHSAAQLNVQRSAFAHGVAAKGGEIFHDRGYFECSECVFEGAYAESYGGAVYLGDLYTSTRIFRSLFTGNETAGLGGAIHLYATGGEAELRIVDSTFHDNGAASLGGAVSALASGLVVVYSTFTDNVADSDLDGYGTGGGVFAQYPSLLLNSILSGNVATITLPQGNVWAWPQDCAGAFTTNGHNIVREVFTGCAAGDPSCCTFSGGPPGTADPQLGPLGYHGGLTRTRSVGPGSPAIGAARCDNALGEPLTTIDQRGAPRPFPTGCDLGAFEHGSLIFSDGLENWNWKWSGVVP